MQGCVCVKGGHVLKIIKNAEKKKKQFYLI